MTALDAYDGWDWADRWPWTQHACERLEERSPGTESGGLMVVGGMQRRWRRHRGRIEQQAFVPVWNGSDVGPCLWLVLAWCDRTRCVVVASVLPDIPDTAHPEIEGLLGGGE